METELIVRGLAWYIVFLFSTVLHEAAHAWTSLKLGDATAHEGGQVTLDPWPHIRREPLGMVVIPVLFFCFTGWMIGWASAPYNALWAHRYPKRAAVMALAGPLANLFLLIAAGLLFRLGFALEVFQPDPQSLTHLATVPDGGFLQNVAFLLSILFFLNLILCVFNLLPVPPLDGSGVIPLVLDDRTARSYLGFIRQPMYSLLGIVIAWKVFPGVFPYVRDLALDVLYAGL